MQSIEKLFAVVDRKIDAFDFTIKKVKGKITGNEYYAVSGMCIVDGTSFAKRVLTIGCPKDAIDTVARAMMLAVDMGGIAMSEIPGLKKIESTSTISGLRKIDVIEESDIPEEYEEICELCGEYVSDCDCYSEDPEEDDECDCDGCSCCDAAPRITLTPSASTAPVGLTQVAEKVEASPGTIAPVKVTLSSGPKVCAYCKAVVAPNFAFCPACGGQQ